MAKDKLKSILREQQSKMAGELGRIGRALRQASEEAGGGKVPRLVDRAVQKIDALSSALTRKDADEILTQAERFIKKNPIIFLGGSFALGFLFGQLMKEPDREST